MKLNWLKKSAIKIGLSLARSYITPDMIKEEARKALTAVAAKAHSGDKTRGIMERTKVIVSAMEDGVVNVEETELILGDIVTQENIDKAFDYIEGKVA